MKTFLNPFLLAITLVAFTTLPACSQSTESPSVEESHEYEVTRDIEWAQPGGHSLTLDIYVPKTGKASYPVLVIFHGGGWLINDKSPMTSMSEYIAKNSEYVVCNVNYRLLVDGGNTIHMNQIIEDAMGAVLWVKDHIAAYKGDPAKLIITGDSAGGHLASMVVLCGHQLESDGFTGNSLGFNPTYLPPGKTAEAVAAGNGLEVQAAILSYAAYDIYASCLGGFETAGNFFWSFSGATPRGIFGDGINVQANPEYYKAVSPVYNIPSATERSLPPQLCTVGSADNLVTPASVQDFVAKLREKGHTAEYWEHQGRPHAYLDGGRNEFLGTEFEKDAPPALDKMIEFMDQVFAE